MRYAVTLFAPDGRTDTRLNLDEQAAHDLANDKRPRHGGSYVYDERRRLVFRKPRPRPQPRYNTRRLSAVQIEAAAVRFENDGEYENGANMRALI